MPPLPTPTRLSVSENLEGPFAFRKAAVRKTLRGEKRAQTCEVRGFFPPKGRQGGGQGRAGEGAVWWPAKDSRANCPVSHLGPAQLRLPKSLGEGPGAQTRRPRPCARICPGGAVCKLWIPSSSALVPKWGLGDAGLSVGRGHPFSDPRGAHLPSPWWLGQSAASLLGSWGALLAEGRKKPVLRVGGRVLAPLQPAHSAG